MIKKTGQQEYSLKSTKKYKITATKSGKYCGTVHKPDNVWHMGGAVQGVGERITLS